MTDPERRELGVPEASNKESVRALVALIGGVPGLIRDGVHFDDLALVLKADPNDDMSGLRHIAASMQYGSNLSLEAPNPTPEPEEEILITPAVARGWLIKSGRTIEQDGMLLPTGRYDHLGEAALMIIAGGEPASLSTFYYEVSDNVSPLSPDDLRTLSRDIRDHFHNRGRFGK